MEKRALRIRLSGRLIAAGAFGSILLIVIVLFSMIGVDELVDIWWFDALGYPFYYWQRLLYRYLVFGGVSLVFFLIFFMNFWIAARYLRHTPDADKVIGKTNYGKINKAFQTGSLLFYVPLSLILTFPLAMPLYQHWEKFLFYIFGRSAGVQDPFFGKDVAFYLFSFPIYSLVQQRLLLAVLVLLAGLVLLYMVKNRLLTRKLFHFSGFARWHLSLVVLAAVAVEIWDLLLQRYGLVFDTTHQPLFTGPGFVQMKVIVPLIWVSLVLLVATAGTLLFALQFRRGYKVLAGLVVVTILAFTVRHADLIPQAFQTYLVKPNAIEKESRFIEKNVQATLNAYDLNRIEVRKFQHERFPEVTAPTHMENVLRNIPVWDANTLSAVFQQLQELRTYYAFPQVSVDRYDVTDNRQQVFLSLRELEYG
ncbi:MAG: COG1615 family transporter, partial [Desulfatitalea sp.]|nr:UPF0182 family protein [Desulfatitalea sp.]NNK00005.1 COG1615 family transporter [Desulfatitalea sp.]